MESKQFCPLTISNQLKMECQKECAWFDNSKENQCCIVRSLLIELIRGLEK